MTSAKIKLIVGLVVVGVIAFFVYPYVASFLEKKKMLETYEKEKAFLEQNAAAMDVFVKETTAENQRTYAKKADQELTNESLSQDTKNIILFRKALALSVLRDPAAQTANVTEAFEIYKKFVSSTGTSPTDVYLRDFSIVALTRLYLQTYFVNIELVNSSDEFFEYGIYKISGYSDRLATLLVLNDMTKRISRTRIDDLMNRANSMTISAGLLTTYGKELKKETYDTLLKELGENLQFFGQLTPRTFTDPVFTKVESNLKYAYAYDVYESIRNKGTLSKETNDNIDKNYEMADTYLRDALSEKDDISIEEMRFYNHISYLESLHRRYGDGGDRTKVDMLIQDTLTDIHSSKELEALAAGFLKSGKYPPTNYFVSLAKTHQNVADYLRSIGM